MQSVKADKLAPNPRQRANPLSVLMFCFALPILFKGRKKTLEPTDLYQVLDEHKADYLGELFYETWQAEVKASRRKNKEPSLLKVILRVFGTKLALSGLMVGIIELGTRGAMPLLLAGLISQFTKYGNGNDLTTQLYAAGLIASSVLGVLLTHPYVMFLMHLAMKMRVSMSSAIYRKALCLSKSALGDTTTGHVVNLISNDLGRFDRALIHAHFLWLAPVELSLAAYFMYKQIGVATFYGISILLLFLPLQAYLGRLMSVLRLRTAVRTDNRVRMMNEIIVGIQVIKMYAWEQPFARLIEQVRRSEMGAIRKVNYLRGVLLSFEITVSRIAIFASLVGFVLMGEQLTAERAFVVTAFYNILRRTVTKLFPQAISQMAELFVSLRRIKVFLMREETQLRENSDNVEQQQQGDEVKESGALIAHSTTNGTKTTTAMSRHASVQIKQLKARWNAVLAEPVLDDINLTVDGAQLVAVIGPVGAGKSSLIQAILGELPAEQGTVEVHGSYSYAAQEPWLFTGSVQDNILFGLPLDRQRYRTVVRKCALDRDFEMLPHGDKTIVGERGASLSGGQKARISLARAVYRKAQLYLLDDPLSAVDTHVARHLFEQCMRDFLRRKLVILVTHQLQFLEHADLIVIMDKGKVSAIGTYASMLQSGQDFAQLLTQSNEQHADQQQAAGDAPMYSRENSQQSQCSTQRQNSVSSLDSNEEKSADQLTTAAPMQTQESRGAGNIGVSMYRKYFGAGNGFVIFALMLFLCIGTQLLASGGDYFVSYWVKNNQVDRQSQDIIYFTAINVSIVIFALLRTVLFFNLAMRSSTQLHNSMFRGVSRAALYFFNTNPSGRILNRFSMDIGQVDEVLPSVMIDCVQVFLTLSGIVIVLCITNPWYLINTVVMLLAFYYVREFYLNTSRDVKRLEAVARSPMYSHLGATLNGLSTVRALGAQRLLIAEYDKYQDMHSSGFYTFLSTNRAFGYYLDCFCVIYIVVIILNSLINPPSNVGQIGLAITQAMSMTGMVQWGMRQSAELENSMTSVERVLEYKNLEVEGDFESPAGKQPPSSWPEAGQIAAEELSLRYCPDPKTDRVLNSLNFVVKPREKVGIVGRTGAGKSSLINALFRLSYNDGSLVIDKRDTQDMGLHDLRSKISIIPQEPVLFSGTMRYNLDPFEQYADAKLWEALEEVHLKDVISELPTGLQSNISEGGSNFSVGQRQLVCLARAILRENRILVMDEATANVDPQTDALIQTTIRKKFKNCTVLTIAHRLHTIMDSDRVMVMDAGHVVEFDTPLELLTATKSKVFHGMAMQMGKSTFDNLLQIAQRAHDEMQHIKSE